MVAKKDTIDSGLEKLRGPFAPNLISKLPKPTKKQTDEVKANFKAGIRCDICGGWHHPSVIHLDYVGHAALTDRLLNVDPLWNWEPMALDENGLPMYSKDGLWIKLTVLGMTRLGFGDAQGKTGPNAIKEMIGDGLRNAGMRFGMALDLWHKGDLHVEDDLEEKRKPPQKEREEKKAFDIPEEFQGSYDVLMGQLNDLGTYQSALDWMTDNGDNFAEMLGGKDSPALDTFRNYASKYLASLKGG